MKTLFIALIAFTLIVLYSFFSYSGTYEWRNALKDGQKSFENDDFEKAKEDYNSAYELDTTRAEVLSNLGNTYFNQNNYQKAKAYYERHLNVEEDSVEVPKIHYNLGNTFFMQNDYLSAIKQYDLCLELVKDSACINNRKIALDMLEKKQNEQSNSSKQQEKGIFNKEELIVKQKADSLHRVGAYGLSKKTVMNYVKVKPEAQTKFKKYLERLDAVIKIDTIRLAK